MLPNFVNDPSSRTLRREEGRKERGILLSPINFPLAFYPGSGVEDRVNSLVSSVLSFVALPYRNRDNRRRCWEDKYLVTENLERVEKRKFNSFNVDLFFFSFSVIL